MEGWHHVNWNSIIYRKEALLRTKIEKLFLAAKDFNTNLAQFLPLCHVTNNMYVCSFTCTISHRHRHALTMDLHTQNLVWKKIIVYEDYFYAILGVFLNIIPKMRFFPKSLQIHAKCKKNPMSHFGEKCLLTDILTYWPTDILTAVIL